MFWVQSSFVCDIMSWNFDNYDGNDVAPLDRDDLEKSG